MLDKGHVDLASLVEDGHLQTRVKDDTVHPGPVFHVPSDVVFHVSPDARRSVPSGSAFSFLGTAGAPVWLLPETQDEQLLWPGWSTELIPDQATAAGVRWSLTDLTGPGEFALFASDPVSLGAVRVLFNSRDGITSADSFEIPKATHAHGNWAFSAEGVYCLKFERRATLTPGGSQSVTSVLAVAVGAVDPRQVDPGQCFAAPTGQPTDPDRSPIPDSALTPDSSGDVRVIPASAGFTPGQLVSVQLDVARAGQWVSPWLHSQPTWLGWKQVDAAGTVQFRLPADAPAGSHRVVLKDRQGELIGWSALTVAAPGKGRTPGRAAGEGSDLPEVSVCRRIEDHLCRPSRLRIPHRRRQAAVPDRR